jgi:glycosyl transferase family 9 (putative heptosyltransferase)
MPRPPDSAAVLFPGALGDLLCFLPTLRALRDRHAGQLLLIGSSTLLELVEMPALATASIDRREIADLFIVGQPIAPATKTLFGGFDHVYSWTGFGDGDVRHRLSAASGGRVGVYPFRGMRPAEHAAEYYARCVDVAPLPIDTTCIRRDQEWCAAFRRQHQLAAHRLFVLHPGSGSPNKNWLGFDPVIRYWRQHHADTIVVVRGPAETHTPAPRAPGVIAADGLTLPQVAALLHHVTLYLGNDSGISHLAAAVGAHGVVLFGASDPAVWAPRSARLRVVHAPTLCGNCPASTFCVHRLPVTSVVGVLEAQATATPRSAEL